MSRIQTQPPSLPEKDLECVGLFTLNSSHTFPPSAEGMDTNSGSRGEAGGEGRKSDIPTRGNRTCTCLHRCWEGMDEQAHMQLALYLHGQSLDIGP